jgi:Flp pilus assembly pilin Flp
MFRTFLREERGQDIVEYSLLLVLLAVAAVFVLTSFNVSIFNIFSKIQDWLVQADSKI